MNGNTKERPNRKYSRRERGERRKRILRVYIGEINQLAGEITSTIKSAEGFNNIGTHFRPVQYLARRCTICRSLKLRGGSFDCNSSGTLFNAAGPAATADSKYERVGKYAYFFPVTFPKLRADDFNVLFIESERCILFYALRLVSPVFSCSFGAADLRINRDRERGKGRGKRTLR